MFLTKFKAAMSAKWKWGHFDGSKTHPQPPPPLQIQADNPDDPAQVAAAIITNQQAAEAAQAAAKDIDFLETQDT